MRVRERSSTCTSVQNSDNYVENVGALWIDLLFACRGSKTGACSLRPCRPFLVSFAWGKRMCSAYSDWPTCQYNLKGRLRFQSLMLSDFRSLSFFLCLNCSQYPSFFRPDRPIYIYIYTSYLKNIYCRTDGSLLAGSKQHIRTESRIPVWRSLQSSP